MGRKPGAGERDNVLFYPENKKDEEDKSKGDTQVPGVTAKGKAAAAVAGSTTPKLT